MSSLSGGYVAVVDEDSTAGMQVPFATLSPGLFAGARVNLSDSWNLLMRGRLHYLLYNIDQANPGLSDLNSLPEFPSNVRAKSTRHTRRCGRIERSQIHPRSRSGERWC